MAKGGRKSVAAALEPSQPAPMPASHPASQNKCKIISSLPHSKFGTAVAKQGALQLICIRLQITEDSSKVLTLTPIDRLVVVVNKAALHWRCEQFDIQSDLVFFFAFST
jgi:hypothetical protein